MHLDYILEKIKVLHATWKEDEAEIKTNLILLCFWLGFVGDE